MERERGSGIEELAHYTTHRMVREIGLTNTKKSSIDEEGIWLIWINLTKFGGYIPYNIENEYAYKLT